MSRMTTTMTPSNAEESDEGEDNWLGPPEVIEPSATFSIEDPDIDLDSSILKDFLSDAPVIFKDDEGAGHFDIDAEEDGGVYEYDDWA